MNGKVVRAKFLLTAMKKEDGSMHISGNAVTDGSEENKKFNDATPGANIYIHIAAGKEVQGEFTEGVSLPYYIDLTRAE